ncbi:MAG: DNA polymerase I [Actinobacteria bacterium]|nr:DNA polymerase I [Actinomycetota bacterium]
MVTVPHRHSDPSRVIESLRELGAERGASIGVAFAPGGVAGLAVGSTLLALDRDVADSCIEAIDAEIRPRWVLWSAETSASLVAHGVRLATCWDVAAVHRLLAGGWRAEPARVWAWLHGLDRRRMPTMGQLDLLGGDGDGGGDEDDPVRPDGFLRPEFTSGGWAVSPERAARWAETALRASVMQLQRLQGLAADGSVAGDPLATARSESTAELLCAELAADGLPVDRAAAEHLIASLVGPRAQDDAEAAAERLRRDEQVLRHLPPGNGLDLRSPADVKTLLRRLGIDVPDTRAWRLEAMRDVHPVVDDLLRWRKAERIATTFGYTWLDEHVGIDGRLRGAWSASDGAAGRMTAQAGLHNLPADLRPVVRADDGCVFVRADLGQIEPRVLAAVSGDEVLARATQDDDLYAPVAKRLGVERSVAKIAVLAAMYGQTSGTAGQALRGMEAAYPVAIRYLDDAARAGQQGHDVRTFGGRLVRMFDIRDGSDYGAASAARGRYARNAMVQGAAAEFFKVWAVTVRARAVELPARIVLCLHDELLLHVREDAADDVVTLLDTCLAEAAHRWFGGRGVRFVADTSIVKSWADAK